MILKRGLLGLILVGSFAGLAAPVVAGSGWLLLKPPEVPGHGEGGTKFEVHAPLPRWRQVQAFDTAQVCEHAKRTWWDVELGEVECRYRILDEKCPFAIPPDPTLPVPTLSEQEAVPGGSPLPMSTLEERIEAIPVRIPHGPPSPEWEREVKQIEAARELKRRAINERYRSWKCVPADAVYQVIK